MGEMSPFDYFVCGGFGGISTVLVGHPLDTIKVRLQTMPLPKPGGLPHYTSTLDCFKKTIRNEGVSGLYKGMGAPLVGVSPIFAISFMGYGVGKQIFCPTELSQHTHLQYFTAGAFSGIFTTFIMAPGERIKCLLQIQEGNGTLKVYDGPVDVVKKLYKQGGIAAVYRGAGATLLRGIFTTFIVAPGGRIKCLLQIQECNGTSKVYDGPVNVVKKLYKQGGIAAVYRGAGATLLRDVPASGLYFLTYEAIQNYITDHGKRQPSVMGTVFAGGLAGIANWLIGMPPDVLKSRLQAAPEGTYPNGIRDVFKKLMKNEGPLALYKGITPVLLRAFPANAACFLGFEMSKKFLNYLRVT